MSLREREEVAQALLALVRKLRNVSEACRQLGVDRSSYYRALKHPGEGRKARSPLATPLALENMILGLCLEFPDWGCDRLTWYLTLKGHAISSPTVQKILIRHGLGKATQRRARVRRP